MASYEVARELLSRALRLNLFGLQCFTRQLPSLGPSIIARTGLRLEWFAAFVAETGVLQISRLRRGRLSGPAKARRFRDHLQPIVSHPFQNSCQIRHVRCQVWCESLASGRQPWGIRDSSSLIRPTRCGDSRVRRAKRRSDGRALNGHC
jgi:hypothetical protein